MNRVVVGFDFSSGSAYAVDLAIDIANRWKADIQLVYVKEKKLDEAPVRAEIEQRIHAVGHLLHGIKMEYVLREGSPADELVKQARLDDAMLLVVGTHGMSGMKTSVLGRNSFKTIERSTVPVLVVREDFNFNKQLETIVVPIDSSDDTRQKVTKAAYFAKTFGSTIHLLGLYTSSVGDVRRIVDNYLGMVARYLDKNEVKYIIQRLNVEKNVSVTTLDYATRVHADLIAIMTEQEKNLSSLLLGTYAQQILNQSTIPILTVRPTQVVTNAPNY
ncbi:MAG: UspA domain protein [bacterium P3]|nr:MAG: UspA domain protein [bacterium P3]KWW42128.1 MAG: UspA domain protein [bacterium F083]